MLDRLGFPSLGNHRRFVTAIGVDAVGSGVFMPVAMLYFLATTHLGLVQVGAAISIASAVALPVGPVIGSLVDRYGARQVLLAGNLLQGGGFVMYLFTDTFAGVVLWTAVLTVGRTAFWGSYGNIVTAISAPGEREKWFGFLGALRNAGFAIGGLASGAAITVGTDAAYAAVVIVNAASYFLAFFLLLAVPDPPRSEHDHLAGNWATVLRDRPYRLLLATQVCYSTAMMVLNFAIPVYATTVLGLSGWVTGAVFTLNTAMIGLGQGLVVRSLTGRIRARVLVLSNLVFVGSYVMLLGAGWLSVGLATVVVIAGGIVYTLGEMIGGPVYAALGAESAPAHLRGRYLAMVQLAWNVASTIAPVLFAWLLARGPEPIWLVMIGVNAAGALLAVPLLRVLPKAGERITNRAEKPVAA